MKSIKNTRSIASRQKDFGGMSLWGNSKTNSFLMAFVAFFFVASSSSCQENNFRIDVWKYRRGQEEVIVKDTINEEKSEFNNPYLKSILLIDSIMSVVEVENIGDTVKYYDNLIVRKSNSIKVGTEENEVFYGGFYNEARSHENINFIYMEGTGVIARHIYGYGYMKLMSRSDGRMKIEFNEVIYDKILSSDFLVPMEILDTLKVYDIKIE